MLGRPVEVRNVVGPIEITLLLPRLDKGARDPSDVSGHDGMIISENDPRMGDAPFAPTDE